MPADERRPFNRIFCIGLNKTGTNSLHAAFLALGIPSVHWQCAEGNIKDIIEANHASGRPLLDGLEHYVAISDWTKPHTAKLFRVLDEQYPGSRFILNTRDIESWLDSREKHVRRLPDLEHLRAEHPDSSWYRIDRAAWRRDYEAHHAAVEAHFADRPDDLLVMNVGAGDGWEKLCPFLGLPEPARPFPVKNVAPDRRGGLRRRLARLIRGR